MNIFYLDKDPKICATYHNDKHCVKMVLEYAQILSTTHRVSYDYSDIQTPLYKSTHINHPSTIWARESKSNYEWLYMLFGYLCDEYRYRYDRKHATDHKLRDILSTTPRTIPNDGFTAPPLAMPDDCKIHDDHLASYRKYYMVHKSHIAAWTNRDCPDWYMFHPGSIVNV